MTPNAVFFGLITAAIIALVIVLIWLCVRLGEAAQALKAFLGTTQESMRESLGEMNQDLRALRTLTENINTAADNITSFTGSIREIGDEVRQIAGNVKSVGDAVQDLSEETIASIRGVRAGFRTGFDVFLRSLFRPGAAR
jgi:uncharacterized protein YoxC